MTASRWSFFLPTGIITVKKINWWVGKQNKNHFEFLCSRHWYYIWVSTHRLQIPALIMQEDPRGGHVFAAAPTCNLTFTYVQKFVVLESCYPGSFLRAVFPSGPLFVLIVNTAIKSVWFYHWFFITVKEHHNSQQSFSFNLLKLALPLTSILRLWVKIKSLFCHIHSKTKCSSQSLTLQVWDTGCCQLFCILQLL